MAEPGTNTWLLNELIKGVILKAIQFIYMIFVV